MSILMFVPNDGYLFDTNLVTGLQFVLAKSMIQMQQRMATSGFDQCSISIHFRFRLAQWTLKIVLVIIKSMKKAAILGTLIAILFGLLTFFVYLGRAETPKDIIVDFYQMYFNSADGLRPSLVFSKSFRELIDQNQAICNEKAKNEICGFKAGGNIYLDAQEIDPNLNFLNSNFSAVEITPGEVEVQLNVYPSAKNAPDHYQRKIIFKMLMEEGRWVVDDIVYGSDRNRSAKKMLSDEIDAYTKNPVLEK